MVAAPFVNIFSLFTFQFNSLETGVEIRVPLFINEGELVQVDTRDGSYLQRVKE